MSILNASSGGRQRRLTEITEVILKLLGSWLLGNLQPGFKPLRTGFVWSGGVCALQLPLLADRDIVEGLQ